MQNLKTKIRRFFFRLKHNYLSVNNLVFLAAIILCVVWTASSISAMSRNWQLAQVLSKKQRELALLNLEVQTAELENEYYRSDEYLELSARQKQNKLLPGENLVYLPKNSETAEHKYDSGSTPTVQPEPSNFSQWMSFLLGE